MKLEETGLCVLDVFNVNFSVCIHIPGTEIASSCTGLTRENFHFHKLEMIKSEDKLSAICYGRDYVSVIV